MRSLQELGDGLARGIANHIELPEVASVGGSIASLTIARQQEMSISPEQLNHADEPYLVAFVALAVIAGLSEVIRRTRNLE